MNASLVFDPLLPWPVIAALGALSVLAVALALWRGLTGWLWRGAALAVVLLALSGPVQQIEDRAALQDIAVILRDDSASNRIGGRAEQTDTAVAHLRARLAGLGLDLRELEIGDGSDNRGTLAMAALGQALGELPMDRLAGVFLVSDGLLHDLEAAPDLPAPLHLLQTGAPDDWDRRLIVANAPSFAILGETFRLALRIENEGAVPQAVSQSPVRVGFSLNGEPMRFAQAPVGEELTLDLSLDRAGVNVLHFVLDEGPGELTGRNNQAVIQINGLRDRLRVLLVSGEPHTGQRTWRNLLKSDPSVDLVHFTILRPPDRMDGVPVNELSLIAFPTRELFIDKIDEFDLIIFDRYRRRGILPNAYFDNIRRYVVDGGALLIAGGVEMASADSIWRSPLGQIFPADPTSRLFETEFLPRISDLGTRHPVTAGLDAALPPRPDGGPGWGHWLRQVDLAPRRGQVVMEGHEGRPLLVLDRAGQGRVALLGSDQAWLWDRGYDGGGPQGELLRRLAHWLMGEPDLDEEALRAETREGRLVLTRRSMEPGPHDLTLTDPEGAARVLKTIETAPGLFEIEVPAPMTGLYRATAGHLEALAVMGNPNPLEFARTVASAAPTDALRAASGGAVAVLHSAMPDLRRVAPGRPTSGRGWLGVVERGAYVTTDLRRAPLLPGWLWLLMAGLLALAGWLREARRAA
jgi:hypothetical protein